MNTILTIVLVLCLSPLCADESAPTWIDHVRADTRSNLDNLLSWGMGKKQESYSTTTPLDEEQIAPPHFDLIYFANQYGYFSSTRPIVGTVSSSYGDLKIICSLLQNLPSTKLQGPQLQITAAELLTKVLAYRDLKLNQKIQLPVEINGKLCLEIFTVDHVFDIWQGMPAFGLVPEKEHLSSLLLFRGTDFSLITKRGIASVMSDLDPAGPGLQAFFHARKELHKWLQLVHSQGNPARTMGFSLGGALAAYTFIYENPLLSDEPSLSLCAPGVAPTVVKEWEKLPSHKKQHFISYINAGDPVSQVGALFGTVYRLSTAEPLKPLTAHTLLMSSQSPLYKTRIDTTKH